jgi:antitoxin CptB
VGVFALGQPTGPFLAETENPADSRSLRLKRLRFRSWHRGTRELDFVMGGFADRHLAELDDSQLGAFEALLEVADSDLYHWIADQAPVPKAFDTDVMALIKNFKITYANN